MKPASRSGKPVFFSSIVKCSRGSQRRNSNRARPSCRLRSPLFGERISLGFGGPYRYELPSSRLTKSELNECSKIFEGFRQLLFAVISSSSCVSTRSSEKSHAVELTPRQLATKIPAVSRDSAGCCEFAPKLSERSEGVRDSFVRRGLTPNPRTRRAMKRLLAVSRAL